MRSKHKHRKSKAKTQTKKQRINVMEEKQPNKKKKKKEKEKRKRKKRCESKRESLFRRVLIGTMFFFSVNAESTHNTTHLFKKTKVEIFLIKKKKVFLQARVHRTFLDGPYPFWDRSKQRPIKFSKFFLIFLKVFSTMWVLVSFVLIGLCLGDVCEWILFCLSVFLLVFFVDVCWTCLVLFVVSRSHCPVDELLRFSAAKLHRCREKKKKKKSEKNPKKSKKNCFVCVIETKVMCLMTRFSCSSDVLVFVCSGPVSVVQRFVSENSVQPVRTSKRNVREKCIRSSVRSKRKKRVSLFFFFFFFFFF